ncbi:MAG: sensor domain-containing diguanylate cyclase [Spirochaetales bacterium]|nr:sensor domain-containing diguanylate cyclase [Spirochaetales bacterium]
MFLKIDRNVHYELLNDIIRFFRPNQKDFHDCIKNTLRLLFKNLDLKEIAVILYDNNQKHYTTRTCADKYGVNENLVTTNIADDPDGFYAKLINTRSKYISDPGIGSLFFPLISNGIYAGFLWLHGNEGTDMTIDDVGVFFMGQCADIIAAGVLDMSAFLYKSRDIRKLESIFKAMIDLNSTLELDKLISSALKNMVEILEFDRVKYFVIDDDEKWIKGIWQYDFLNKLKPIAEEKYAFSPDDPFAVNPIEVKIRKAIAASPEVGNLLQFHTMKAKEKIIGFIQVDNLFSCQYLTDNDINYLGLLISYVSQALENARLYRQIEDLAIHDGLTGLYNSSYFHGELGKAIEAYKRYKSNFCLVILDIDHFKNYNDRNGHLAGDQLLRLVGGNIRKCVRRNDVAGRYGGDEFVILLRECDEAAALNFAERLAGLIRAIPVKMEATRSSVTVSVGLASMNSADITAKILFNMADQALYKAKESGRNRIIAYSRN